MRRTFFVFNVVVAVALVMTGVIGPGSTVAGELPAEYVVRKADGSVETRGVYTRDGWGRVTRFAVEDGEGKALYAEVPYYGKDGRILRADRLLPDGSLDKAIVYLKDKAVVLDKEGAVVETQAFSQGEYFKGTMNSEPLKVVASYEEFAALGLKGNVVWSKGKPCMLLVESADAKKVLPEWMGAFYVVGSYAAKGWPWYQFNAKKPDRVSVNIPWAEEEVMLDSLLVIAPVLGEGQTFHDKPYVAIRAADLVKWRVNAKADK